MVTGARHYNASDRQVALAHIPQKILDNRDSKLTVANTGPQAGWVRWIDPDNGSLPILAEIWVPQPTNRKLFYRLIAFTAEWAIERGYKHAWFPITDIRVLTMVKRDFNVTVQVEAIDTATSKPSRWRIEVGLADALEQLQAVI